MKFNLSLLPFLLAFAICLPQQSKAACDLPAVFLTVTSLGNNEYQANWTASPGATSYFLQWGVYGCPQGTKGGGQLFVNGTTETFNPILQGSVPCVGCDVRELTVVVWPVCANGEKSSNMSNNVVIEEDCPCPIEQDLFLSFCHFTCDVCQGGPAGHVCIIDAFTNEPPVGLTYNWGNSMVSAPNANCPTFSPDAIGSLFSVTVTNSEGCTAVFSEVFECEPTPEYDITACPWVAGTVSCSTCNQLCIQAYDDFGVLQELNGSTWPAEINWISPSSASGVCPQIELVDGQTIIVEVTFTPGSTPQEIVYVVDCSNLALVDPGYHDFEIINIKDESVADQTVIMVYPNPFQDEINIDYLDFAIDGQIDLLNINGQLVNKYTSLQESIDMKNLSSGIYYLRFITDHGIQLEKIVKR